MAGLAIFENSGEESKDSVVGTAGVEGQQQQQNGLMTQGASQNTEGANGSASDTGSGEFDGG